MKALIKIFCGLLVISVAVHALPADRPSSDIEKLGRVELEKDSSSDSEEYPPRPLLLPLDGFLSGFNDMFERMRQQMIYLMSQVPRIGLGAPEGGNTTSVTKVIDGHKVIINETVYKSGDGEDAAAVFKVRVVDIRPDSSEDTSENPESEVTRNSVESLEHSHENEIPKSLRTAHAQKRKVSSNDFYTNSLAQFKNLETFDYPINNNLETFDDPDLAALETFDTFGDNIPNANSPAFGTMETFDEEPLGNNIESLEDEDRIINKNRNRNRFYEDAVDLSNDILINKIAEKEGRPTNPNAETFDVIPAKDLSRDTYINEIAAQRGVPRNPDSEMIENFRTYVRRQPTTTFERIVPFSEVSHDLSRDTYVNEIAARRNMPLNTDAEFMNLQPRSRYYYRTHPNES